MRIEIELTKKHLYISLAVLALLGIALAAADVDLYGAWHDADDIEFQDMTLQEALDTEALTVGSALYAETVPIADLPDDTLLLCGRPIEEYCVT